MDVYIPILLIELALHLLHCLVTVISFIQGAPQSRYPLLLPEDRARLRNVVYIYCIQVKKI
jgi:hypothetical protein